MDLYCLAHGADLDGLGCHAILERYARKEGYATVHFYVDYDNFSEAVGSLPSMEGERIVIADLGYNPSFNEGLRRLDLLGKTNDVLWFDHHDWDRAPPYDNIRFNIDATRCGADIVRGFFLPDDGVARAVASLSCDHDFRRDNDLAWKLYELIPAKFDKDDLMRRLSRGEFWDEEREVFYQEYQEKKAGAVEFLKDHSRVFDVVGLRFRLGFSNEVLSSTLASQELLGEDIDVAIGIWPKGKMSFRRNDKDVDIKALAALFGGGGRKEAAGGFFRKTNEDNYLEVFDGIMNRIKEAFGSSCGLEFQKVP